MLYSLGYRISTNDLDTSNIPYMKLDPAKYRMSNAYIPKPLDLSDIHLPQQVPSLYFAHAIHSAQLESLGDLLAENAHDVWAVKRIQQGWTYGYSKARHPCASNSRITPFSGRRQQAQSAAHPLRAAGRRWQM